MKFDKQKALAGEPIWWNGNLLQWTIRYSLPRPRASEMVKGGGEYYLGAEMIVVNDFFISGSEKNDYVMWDGNGKWIDSNCDQYGDLSTEGHTTYKHSDLGEGMFVVHDTFGHGYITKIFTKGGVLDSVDVVFQTKKGVISRTFIHPNDGNFRIVRDSITKRPVIHDDFKSSNTATYKCWNPACKDGSVPLIDGDGIGLISQRTKQCPTCFGKGWVELTKI